MRAAARPALSGFALALLGLGLAGTAHAAAAPAAGVSYSTWIVSADSVMLRFVLPVAGAQALAGTDIPVLSQSRLGAYVLAHTQVWSAGHECPASDQGYDLGKVDPIDAGPGLYGFEIVFRCAEPPGDLVLYDHALFERVPTHVDFARIEVGRHVAEQLFTAGHEQLQVPAAGAMPDAGPGRYVWLGLLHILRSPDRLCFLLAALLLVRRRLDLGQIILGLGGGYGLSLLLQAGGFLQPQMTLVGAFMGFLVMLPATVPAVLQLERRRGIVLWSGLLLLSALVAAVLHAGRPALLLAGAALLCAGLLALAAESGRRPALWLLPAVLYGFLDGFVLPAMLAPLQLAQRVQAPMALGYDLGSLLTGAALMALLAGAFASLRRGDLAPPRALMDDVAAACLGGLGAFWLLSRLHS